MEYLVNNYSPRSSKEIRGTNGSTEVQPWALGSCGVGTIQSFGYHIEAGWDEMAGWMSQLYQQLYGAGNVIYALSDTQLGTWKHKALLTIGSREIAVWANAYHNPKNIHLFHVNIRNCSGRFCDEYGAMLSQMPDNPPELKDAVPLNNGQFTHLPTRPKNDKRSIAQPV